MHRSYEYDANVLVVLAIAALAILACVVLVSLGRGGELTEFPPDVPPLDLPEPGQLTAVDFMALQLPVNLVGYHTQSVDETLRRAATAISARDTRIAVLEQRVSELLSSRLHARQEVYAAPGGALRTDHEPPAAPLDLSQEGDSAADLRELGDQHSRPYADGPQDAAEPSAAVEPDTAVEPEADATPSGAQPGAEAHAQLDSQPDAGPDVQPAPQPGPRLDARPDGADVRPEARPDVTAAFDAAAAADEDGREAEAAKARSAENGQQRDADSVRVPAGEDAEKRDSEPVRVAPGEDGDERK